MRRRTESESEDRKSFTRDAGNNSKSEEVVLKNTEFSKTCGISVGLVP